MTQKENFIVKPDGSKHCITPKNGSKFELEELQELVGGYIEVVRLSDSQSLIINENGKVGDAVIINNEQLD